MKNTINNLHEKIVNRVNEMSEEFILNDICKTLNIERHPCKYYGTNNVINCGKYYYKTSDRTKGRQCKYCNLYACEACMPARMLFPVNDVYCIDCYRKARKMVTIHCMYCKTNNLKVYGELPYVCCDKCNVVMSLQKIYDDKYKIFFYYFLGLPE